MQPRSLLVGIDAATRQEPRVALRQGGALRDQPRHGGAGVQEESLEKWWFRQRKMMVYLWFIMDNDG